TRPDWRTCARLAERCAMSHFQPSQEQRTLTDTLGRSIADLLPLSRLHEPDQDEKASIKPLAELGCLGIALPERIGGTGLSAVEESLIFERLGRQLVVPAAVAAAL